jgi:tetratricopeptide (TPR) repeat protein
VLNEYLAKINAYLRVFPPLRKYLLQSISENSSAPGPASGDGRSSFSAEMERIERILRSALPAVRRLADLVGQAGTRLGSILETRSRTQAGEDSVELHVTAGRAWAELGRLNEAWPHYRRALILNPDNEALVIEASGICAARERAPAARRLITDLRERVGGSAALDEAEQRLELRVRKWEARASEACEQGDMVTALLAARKLAAAEPENENARRIAGQAEAALHNRAPAVRNRAAPERTAETLGS